ncbi:hypothetical protein Tco_0864879 [Tanacetum coccineum]
MPETIPPMPPSFGQSSQNNAENIPVTNTINISTPIVNNVGNEDDLPQLLDSRAGSHVTNVPIFDEEDFTSWKSQFLVYLDGFERFLLEILEDGPYVPMASTSTSENPFKKPIKPDRRLVNQDKRLKSIIVSCLPKNIMKSIIQCTTLKQMWTDLVLTYEGPAETRETKIQALRLKFNPFNAHEGETVSQTYTRLKILLNDLGNNDVTIPQAEVNATFVNSLPRKWLSMNQTQRANNPIKNDTLAQLYGKYNYEEGLIESIYKYESERFTIQGSSTKALVANFYSQDSDSDIEEDTRSSKEYLPDLSSEFHDRALLADQRRLVTIKRSVIPTKSPHRLTLPTTKQLDDESLSSDDEETTRVRAFIAIAEDEPAVGKGDARSGQRVDITMKKVHRLLTLSDNDERKHVLNYTNVDLHFVEEQRKNLLNKFHS